MKDREGADRSGAIPGAVPTDGNDDLDAMDAGDLELLAKVSEMYEALDPTPEMLPDLVLFGLQAVDLDAELARLVESELLTSAGAGSRAVEQARRVTFSSDHLTVMVAVSDRPDGAVRLDGWSTPGGGLQRRTSRQWDHLDHDVRFRRTIRVRRGSRRHGPTDLVADRGIRSGDPAARGDAGDPGVAAPPVIPSASRHV